MWRRRRRRGSGGDGWYVGDDRRLKKVNSGVIDREYLVLHLLICIPGGSGFAGKKKHREVGAFQLDWIGLD